MQNRMKIGFAAVTLAALGLVAAGGGMFTASAQTEGFSEGQVKSIEKIVKDYLMTHPEVLTGSAGSLRAQGGGCARRRDPRPFASVLQSACRT